MSTLRAAKALLVAALATVLLLTTHFSTAVFTSSSSSTATVRAAADWTPPTVGLIGMASTVRGTISLTASASDGETGISRVIFERRRVGTPTWSTVCTVPTSPYSCTWATSAPDDGRYDVRAVATDGAGLSTESAASVLTVDNTPPTVTMKDPGTPLSGVRTFEATGVADATSGVARVDIQHRLGTGTWQHLCTITSGTSVWSCSVDTGTLANGTYSFRAVASDVAGNSRTSGEVTGRQVSNVVQATVTLANPGAVLTGTVQLTATTTSDVAVASVRFEYAPTGTTGWQTVCTDTTAPWTCAWDTTKVTDGQYDLRAVMSVGDQTFTSPVVTDRGVSNAAPRGADIQTANGGSTAGMIELQDRIVYTFASVVSPGRLLDGWNGAETDVTVQLVDDGTSPERMSVVNSRLGVVTLNGDHLKKERTLTLGGRMTATTVTVGGRSQTVVTVRLSSAPSGSTGHLQSPVVTTPARMVWTDPAGRQVLESEPPLDVDF